MDELLEVHRRLLGGYEVGVVREVRGLSGGMFMKPVVVETDGGKFVLRGTRFRATPGAFAFQAQAMNWAAEHGVRCTRVLRDRDGQYGRQIDGAMWAACEYLEGATYPWPHWWRTKTERPGFIERVAQQIAQLHDVLADAEPDGDAALSYELPPIQFDQLAAVRLHWDESLDALARLDAIEAVRSRDTLMRLRDTIASHWQWLGEMLTAGGVEQLPRQIVHGDLSPVNMVFQDGTDQIGVVDWDTVHIGYRLYDGLGDVLNRPPVDEARYHRLRVELVRRYVIGYGQATQRPLTDRELSLIGPFCLSRQMEDLRQRLRVLPELAAEKDDEYAALIGIRVGMMDQIRNVTPGEWIG